MDGSGGAARQIERRGGAEVERGDHRLDRRHRHLDGHDHRRRRPAGELLVAGGSTCVTPTSPRTWRGRRGAVGLDGLLLFPVDVAPQPPQARLVAGVEAGRREDRLLDIALDDLVPHERDVGVPGAAGAGRVEQHGAHLVEEGVPGREDDLATAARARLGHREQGDAAVVHRLDHGLGGRLQDRDELVQRPHVQLVEVPRLAADAEQVHVGVAEEVAGAVRGAQVVVEERDRAADQVRAADGVHRVREQDAQPVVGLPATRPQRGERLPGAVPLDGEVFGGERVGRMHAPILPP